MFGKYRGRRWGSNAKNITQLGKVETIAAIKFEQEWPKDDIRPSDLFTEICGEDGLAGIESQYAEGTKREKDKELYSSKNMFKFFTSAKEAYGQLLLWFVIILV